MKLKGIFEAQSITQINGNSIEIYPTPGGPVAPGVGIQITGKYRLVPQAGISGYFSYSRTNAYADNLGRIHGIGILNLKLESPKGHKVDVSVSYTNRTVNPAETFSLDRVDAFVTGASYNDKLATGTIHLRPIEGGRQFEVRLCLVPVR